ncbi:hypothetical protein [Sulfurisphaera ohwakuensis]|uniref:hypothetical protein n=1 Tax=Sulfurisphaera ohwakuensis TaxID=69656 RepID=UPI0036F22E1B
MVSKYLQCKKKNSIDKEPLAWEVWDDIGAGYRGKYRDITTITKGASNKIDFMDIYRYDENCSPDDSFTHYLVRIFMQYGPEGQPKIIIKLPKKPNEDFKLISMVITVTGENVKAVNTIHVSIGRNNNDYEFCIEKECKTFFEITKKLKKYVCKKEYS